MCGGQWLSSFFLAIRSKRLTIEKSVNDELAVPFHQVVDVTEDATIHHEPPMLISAGSLFGHTTFWANTAVRMG